MKIRPQIPIKSRENLKIGDIVEIIVTKEMGYLTSTLDLWDGKTCKVTKVRLEGIEVDIKRYFNFRNIITKENPRKCI